MQDRKGRKGTKKVEEMKRHGLTIDKLNFILQLVNSSSCPFLAPATPIDAVSVIVSSNNYPKNH